VYLVFSLAMCLATLIASLNRTCIFSIEIEVLYWMYWGGIICVFGSAPCTVRLGTVSKWIKLDWTAAFQFSTHWIMTYHGIWFIISSYDQSFSRMPCGTTHFFFAPVLDPSEEFWVLRDVLTLMALPLFLLLALAFPLVAMLLIPEVKHAVQDSTPYRVFFGRRAWYQQSESVELDLDEQPTIFERIYSIFKAMQNRLRVACSLPAQRLSGIRLVTPVDVKNRK
jgi:hypothetical protein